MQYIEIFTAEISEHGLSDLSERINKWVEGRGTMAWVTKMITKGDRVIAYVYRTSWPLK